MGFESRAGCRRCSKGVHIAMSIRCLEQFFAYLELSVANRVKAKMGRARSLDAVSRSPTPQGLLTYGIAASLTSLRYALVQSRLSNLMSHAALAHATKARSPLSRSASSRSWHNSVPVNISPHQVGMESGLRAIQDSNWALFGPCPECIPPWHHRLRSASS